MQSLQRLVQTFSVANSACRWSVQITSVASPNPLRDLQFMNGLFRTLSEFFCLGHDEVKSEFWIELNFVSKLINAQYYFLFTKSNNAANSGGLQCLEQNQRMVSCIEDTKPTQFAYGFLLTLFHGSNNQSFSNCR